MRVFSIATSRERAKVPMASASVKNFTKFPNVKFPDESWNAYRIMIIRGNATNSKRKIA
jgi:hypothetical protein